MSPWSANGSATSNALALLALEQAGIEQSTLDRRTNDPEHLWEPANIDMTGHLISSTASPTLISCINKGKKQLEVSFCVAGTISDITDRSPPYSRLLSQTVPSPVTRHIRASPKISGHRGMSPRKAPPHSIAIRREHQTVPAHHIFVCILHCACIRVCGRGRTATSVRITARSRHTQNNTGKAGRTQ